MVFAGPGVEGGCGGGGVVAVDAHLTSHGYAVDLHHGFPD
jgi:hypothetical protein